MTERELVEQVVSREVSNILGQMNPTFRMFSSTITKYTMNLIGPYIDAFIDPDTSQVNTEAASAFLKQETAEKIESFMKKFNEERGNNGV